MSLGLFVVNVREIVFVPVAEVDPSSADGRRFTLNALLCPVLPLSVTVILSFVYEWLMVTESVATPFVKVPVVVGEMYDPKSLRVAGPV